MLYLTSALELYFPYDFCLYPGMTALESFALKFIPPITAIITAGAVTVGIYVKRYVSGKVFLFIDIHNLSTLHNIL